MPPRHGVYVERPDGSLRSQWVKEPGSAELAKLPRTLGERIGRYLEHQGLPVRDAFEDEVSPVSGFSLHSGVSARVDQRKKLERLCRYISSPAIAEKQLSLMPNGNVRYRLKTPYRDGTTGRRSDT